MTPDLVVGVIAIFGCALAVIGVVTGTVALIGRAVRAIRKRKEAV